MDKKQLLEKMSDIQSTKDVNKNPDVFSPWSFLACADILLPEIEHWNKLHLRAVTENIITLKPKITQLEKENAELKVLMEKQSELHVKKNFDINELHSDINKLTAQLAVATTALEFYHNEQNVEPYWSEVEYKPRHFRPQYSMEYFAKAKQALAKIKDVK